ncbi:MAG: cytochrome c [bacterium]
MKSIKQPWKFMIIIVVSAGLIGCGSGTSNETNSTEETPESKSKQSQKKMTRSEKWKQIKLPEKPKIDEELIEKGKSLFTGKLGCATCHGKNGTGNGPASSSLTNTETGKKISPRNFTNPKNFKWKASMDGIARTVLTGGKNSGSPMPPMKGTVSPEELWAVTSYVYTFRGKKPPQFTPEKEDE